MRPRTLPHLVGVLVAWLVTASPGIARADNLAGLIWPVVLWPVGLLCLLVLAVLSAIASRRKKHLAGAERGARALGFVVAALSAVIGPGYALFVVLTAGGDGLHDGPIIAVTLLPVLLFSVVGVLHGVRLARRAAPALRSPPGSDAAPRAPGAPSPPAPSA